MRSDPAPAVLEPRTPTLPVPPAATPGAADPSGGLWGSVRGVLFGSTGPRGGRHDGIVDSMARSAARQLGSQIVRGVLGSILKGR